MCLTAQKKIRIRIKNKTAGHAGIACFSFALKGNRAGSPHFKIVRFKWWEHVTSFHCLFLLFFTGRGTCTGAFEKPAPLYQGRKHFLCGRRHFIPTCCVRIHHFRSMGILALQLRLQRCLSRAGKGTSCYFRHFRMNGRTEKSEE